MPNRTIRKLHNLPAAESFRRELRNNLTPAEAALWNILKRSKVDGRKFRRQHSVGRYVLDFFCPAERLAIELDGQVHLNALTEIHDQKRRAFLRDQGIKVLRFENDVVFKEPIYLIEQIKSQFGWWEK